LNSLANPAVPPRRDREYARFTVQSMTSSHSKRWLTALVAVPLLVLVIGKGGRVFFALFVGSVAAVGLLEYYALALSRETTATKAAGLVLGLTLFGSFYAGVQVILVVLVLVFLGCAMISLARFGPQAPEPDMLYKHVTGLVYVPFLLGHLILIRSWDQGITWTFLLMTVVFAGDMGAYYIGKALGRHKLWPSVSPNKTVEGAIGGLAANLLVGLLFKPSCCAECGWGSWVGLILVMGVLGQTGDLVESMLKRSVHLKDSGNLFPGHGGLLDRIDAILFAAPTLYYFKTYLL
jgi:phosphatidate cytidylyltransferase